MRQLSFLAGRLILVVCAVLASTACSTGGTAPPAREAVVRVDEKDFRVVVRRKHVAPGDVRLVLRNHGPVAHELIVVRGFRHLPLRSDGLTIDEDALPGSTVIEAVRPGSVETKHLHLAPGRYQLFCNMAGHYLAGMHAELVVG
jgi:plastocyanin